MKKVRFSRSTFEVIYKFAKAFIYHIFEDVNLYAIYVTRVTLLLKNIQL